MLWVYIQNKNFLQTQGYVFLVTFTPDYTIVALYRNPSFCAKSKVTNKHTPVCKAMTGNHSMKQAVNVVNDEVVSIVH